MKEFTVEVDIKVSKRIYVDAENEKEAKAKVNEMVKNYPHYYYTKADAYVSHEIYDVYEDE